MKTLAEKEAYKTYQHAWKSKLEVFPVLVMIGLAVAALRLAEITVGIHEDIIIAIACVSVSISYVMDGESHPDLDAPTAKWLEFVGLGAVTAICVGVPAYAASALVLIGIEEVTNVDRDIKTILIALIGSVVSTFPAIFSIRSHNKRPVLSSEKWMRLRGHE